MIFYKKRDVNGILLIDKPTGLSSNQVLQKIKYIYLAKKAGYTGTLDPLATGMLPICFGKATKFSHFLSNSNKHYVVTAKLGERTDTSDSTGKIINIKPVLINQTILEDALVHFRGKINYIPSVFSAIKYKGKPMYKYAREGIKIIPKSRLSNIYHLNLIKLKHNYVILDILCSKGTYIRTIIDNLGEFLGCGMHVTMLRRLSVSQYLTNKMILLKKIQEIITSNTVETFNLLDNLLLPVDSLLFNMPKLNLSPNIAKLIKHGKKILVNTIFKDCLVRLTEGKDDIFFGVGKISSSYILTPYRLLS